MEEPKRTRSYSRKKWDPEKVKIFFEKGIELTPYRSLLGRVYSYDDGPARFKWLMKTRYGEDEVKMSAKSPAIETVEQLEQMLQVLSECRDELKKHQPSPI